MQKKRGKRDFQEKGVEVQDQAPPAPLPDPAVLLLYTTQTHLHKFLALGLWNGPG